MGYHKDLDELPQKKLEQELERRWRAQIAGLCDYCGRPPEYIPCKEVYRHRVSIHMKRGRHEQVHNVLGHVGGHRIQ